MTDDTTKKKRGFASMDPEMQKAISSKGGKSAHAQGVAHQFSSDEARAAGRKGGQTTIARHRARKQAEAGVIDADFDG